MDMNKVMADIFKSEQAKLPPEQRAATNPKDYCGTMDDDYRCTKPKGHAGNHIAHGIFGGLHMWD